MLIMNPIIFSVILIGHIYCENDLKELHYRGLSITWRRLVPSKSDEIRLEMIITIALSDKSFSLCDAYHPKTHLISPDFGLECVESWDHCLSWPMKSLSVQCQSRSHGNSLKIDQIEKNSVIVEYPKSVIFDEIDLSFPSGTDFSNVYYKLQFPPENYSCCWESFDWIDKSVQLTTTLNLLKIIEINSPPISRFPEHLYIDPNKPFIHSLEVYDPDEDPFECSLLSSQSFLTINENCQLIFKSSGSKLDYVNVIQIEIIEYTNTNKDQIRSRLPYHFIAFVDSINPKEMCRKLPVVQLINIENKEIHVELNEIVLVNVISSSECRVEMDECLVTSPFHWRIKSHIEKRIANEENEVDYLFEWIPKSIEQCGFQIHCIRCLDQLANLNEKCIRIFVNGSICQIENPVQEKCSWSSFGIWLKFNQTFYKRHRICYHVDDHRKSCAFCLGSSIQFQSSLAFLKDYQLFEESLLSPQRAYSTMKIILIASSIWLCIFVLSILLSIFHSITTRRKNLSKN